MKVVFISEAAPIALLAVLRLGEMTRKQPLRFFACIFVVVSTIIVLSPNAFAWNIPTHMITGAIAQRLLEGTEPGKAAAIEVILKQHPRYADGWRDSRQSW